MNLEKPDRSSFLGPNSSLKRFKDGDLSLNLPQWMGDHLEC